MCECVCERERGRERRESERRRKLRRQKDKSEIPDKDKKFLRKDSRLHKNFLFSKKKSSNFRHNFLFIN